MRWPRGRVLGGSSATNFLVYLRGDPACYDAWERAGCEGWGYDDVLPAFKRLEDHTLGPSAQHGEGGPVRVTSQRWQSPLVDAFLDAAAEAGLTRVEDLDDPGTGSAGRYFLTVRDGQRESAATAYLSAAEQRPNLEIRTGALVHRIAMKGGWATGVEISRRRQVERIEADAVVLCAGAVGSPAILLRSGIGPAEEIGRHGIAPVYDAPEVGRNLSDHLIAPVVFGAPRSVSAPEAALRPSAAISYLRERGGPWSSNFGAAGAIIRSRPDAPLPDLQLTFRAGSLRNHGRNPLQRAFSIGVVGLQPESRGRVRLRAADPCQSPVIDPRYLSDAHDARVLLDGIRLARRIVGSAPLSGLSNGEREPGSERLSDEGLMAWLRRNAQTSYHPVGTCRMGSDVSAVVDPGLRVRGVDGLWIADASVMPRIVSANTNAACMMIGERAAEMIATELQEKP
jgi:choline dehydrogenase